MQRCQRGTERTTAMILAIRISLVRVGVRAGFVEVARIWHALRLNGEGAYFQCQPLFRSTTGSIRLYIPGTTPHDQRAGGQLIEELIALPQTVQMTVRDSHDDL